MTEMTATVTTLLPIASNKKVNANGSNHSSRTSLTWYGDF